MGHCQLRGVVKLMRWSGKARLRFLKGQRGLTLIETVVAAGILAAIGVVFMSAMFTGYRSVGILDEQQQAEALVRSQLEAIKSSAYKYDGSYPVSVDLPTEYSMDITVTPPTCIGKADSCTPMNPSVTTIQEITVSVYHGNKPILSVACYKAVQ